MSSYASRCLSSALEIDLSGQFVPQVAKALMRSSAAKFWGLNSQAVFSDHVCAAGPADAFFLKPSAKGGHVQYPLLS